MGYASDNSLVCIDWNTKCQVSSFTNHSNNFNAITFVANRYLIGGDTQGGIIIHNCNSHLLSCHFDKYIGMSGINCINNCKHRINWFISCNDNGYLYLFDITREKIIYQNNFNSANQNLINTDTNNNSGSFLNISGFSSINSNNNNSNNNNNNISFNTNRNNYSFSSNITSSVLNECCFNPVQSSLIVTCGLNKYLMVHDINTQKIIYNIETKSPLSCVSYLPTSDYYIMACSCNGDLYLYDTRKLSSNLNSSSFNSELTSSLSSASALISSIETGNCILGLSIHNCLQYSEILQNNSHKYQYIINANNNTDRHTNDRTYDLPTPKSLNFNNIDRNTNNNHKDKKHTKMHQLSNNRFLQQMENERFEQVLPFQAAREKHNQTEEKENIEDLQRISGMQNLFHFIYDFSNT